MTQGHFKLVRGGGLSSFPDKIAPEMRSMLFLNAMTSLLLLLHLSTMLFAAFGTAFLFFLFFLLAMLSALVCVCLSLKKDVKKR